MIYSGWNAIKPNQTELHYIYIYMYKKDLALNNLQWLTSHEKQPNQVIYIENICIKKIWH